MINKLNILIVTIIFVFFSSLVLADELDIKAKSLEVDKDSRIITAEGNVLVSDIKNNMIVSDKIKYNKEKNILNTFGKTEILTSENFKVESKNIIYDNNKKIVSSNNQTRIIDKDGNIISVNMFNYILEKNIFVSSGEIKITDKKNNEYYFTEIYIDEKKRKIVGSDIKAFLNDGSFKYDPRNEPRFFANSASHRSSFLNQHFE